MSFAYLRLYTGDYIRDTQHLSMSEHGAYLKLLIYCWDQKGPAPLDERRLLGICNARSGDEIEAMRRVLSEFFIRMDDGWYNRRMQIEIEKASNISTKRSRAGQQGYKARAKRLPARQANAKQMPSICQTNASILSTSISTNINPKDQDATAVAVADPWTYGIDLLTRESGLAQATARSYIGALCKQWPEATVLDALMAASGKADPKAYARKWLDDKPRKGQRKRSAAEELIEELERERQQSQ